MAPSWFYYGFLRSIEVLLIELRLLLQLCAQVVISQLFQQSGLIGEQVRAHAQTIAGNFKAQRGENGGEHIQLREATALCRGGGGLCWVQEAIVDFAVFHGNAIDEYGLFLSEALDIAGFSGHNRIRLHNPEFAERSGVVW